MSGQKRAIYEFDDFRLETGERRLLRDGQPVALPAKAFDLLVLLVENNNRLLAKEELYSRLWRDQIVEESNLSVQMSALRKALGERRDAPVYIGTVIGSGYRFTARVRKLKAEPADELSVERESIEHLVVEAELKESSEDEKTRGGAEETGAGTIKPEKTRAASFKSSLRLPASLSSLFAFSLFRISALAVLLAAACGGYWFYRYYTPLFPDSPAASERRINIARVTNDGRVDSAALAPDGKYVAYVLIESEGSSLWLRQTGTASDIRILAPVPAEIWGLTFAPDGKFIYYNLYGGEKIDFELYRVPSLGGAVEKIPNVSTRAVAFAPDGARFAFIESNSAANFNSLVVADADGNDRRILARKNYPHTFYTEGQALAWSPDGKTIACLLNSTQADASFLTIAGIDPNDGTEAILSAHEWSEISSLGWVSSESLLISAKDNVSTPARIWLLTLGQEAPRQMTGDLNHYSSLSVSADAKTIAAVQTSLTEGIYVGAPGGDFREIVSEVGELHPLAWTPDGRLVFRSLKDGAPNLWTMDADGGARRQLTTGAAVDHRGLCATADGKYLVFVSHRSGKSNLWRADADGGNLTRLTDGEADAYPACPPDASEIVFQRGIRISPALWKVAPTGGAARPLIEPRAKWAAISGDGSLLSYFRMSDGKWRIKVISTSNLETLQSLDAPADLKHSAIVWSPDRRALFYVGAVGNVGNLRSLPLDGAPGAPLTSFETDWLADFALSADGRMLAAARSRRVSDVILIENEAISP